MPATATEKWSGPVVGKSTDGPKAVRVWDVIGAIDGDDAVAASGIADINDPYKTDDARLCRDVDARQVSVGVFEVSANYSIPPNGQWPTKTTDPLQEPAIVQWQSVVVTLPFDRDINGKPIVNPAGDAFSNAPTRTYVYKVLRVTKNRSYYDYNNLKQYENTVNNAPLNLGGYNLIGVTVGGHTFDTQTMKCVTIEPASPYKAGATVIPITATFEIWERTDGITTDKPFQLRILAQGINGWYGTGKPGHICTQEGDIVQSDKRMDQTGKPLDATYMIRDGSTIAAPIANPTPVTWCDYEVTADAVYQVFKSYKLTNFSALFLALGV